MTQDLTLRHRMPDPFSRTVVGKCVWCGQDSWTTALTPFRPDLGALPLHLTCGVFLRDAYTASRAGLPIGPDDAPNLIRFGQAIALLEAGA